MPHGWGRITWKGGTESEPPFLHHSTPLQTSPCHLHSFPIQAELRTGEEHRRAFPAKTRSSCLTPSSIVAKREAGAHTVLEVNWCWHNG